MTQDVLATLTRAQREAVREVVARAWQDGESGFLKPTTESAPPYRAPVDYARLALPEPAPRTVTRPRVEVFHDEAYRIVDGTQWWRDPEGSDDDEWLRCTVGPTLKNRDDAARWLALWDNPTETVEVDDDA
jgi:hypothetical protein